MIEIQIENRIWIEKNGKPYLGSGRVELLEMIDKTGSINRAAKFLNMSYKKAWNLVKSMNSLSSKPIVEKETGGRNGGGTILTKEGKKLVTEFRKLQKKSKNFLDKEVKNCCID